MGFKHLCLCSLAVLGCGRTGLSTDATDAPDKTPNTPGILSALPLSQAPLFYVTVQVGSTQGGVVGPVHASADVRAYVSGVAPGEPISLADGESLSLNGVRFVQAPGSLLYEASQVPLSPDSKYQLLWSRPLQTVGFYPIEIPSLVLTLAPTLTAGTPIALTTTPVVSNLGWETSTACAKPVQSMSGFEGGSPDPHELALFQQPCETDVGVTTQTEYDVAFVDPATQEVTGRGHVDLTARSSAWQHVAVVP